MRNGLFRQLWRNASHDLAAMGRRGDGSALVLSVLGGYGQADARIASPFGDGGIRTRGYSLATTLSWFDSRLKSPTPGTLTDHNHGRGEAYSVEVGKRWPVGERLSLTPQVQMVYSTVGFDRFTDSHGAVASSRRGDSLQSRWGRSPVQPPPMPDGMESHRE